LVTINVARYIPEIGVCYFVFNIKLLSENLNDAWIAWIAELHDKEETAIAVFERYIAVGRKLVGVNLIHKYLC
jgi:hypothetical protein